MSLMPSLCAALERVGGERLVMRAGERPHVLAGDRRHDVASAILSVNAVEALAEQILSIDSRRELREKGTASETIQATSFPHPLMAKAERVGDEFSIELVVQKPGAEREPAPPVSEPEPVVTEVAAIEPQPQPEPEPEPVAIVPPPAPIIEQFYADPAPVHVEAPLHVETPSPVVHTQPVSYAPAAVARVEEHRPVVHTMRTVPSPASGERLDLQGWIAHAIGRGATTLYLRAGAPASARIDDRIERLSEDLVDASVLDEASTAFSRGGDGQWHSRSDGEWVRDYQDLGHVSCRMFSDHQGFGLVLQMRPHASPRLLHKHIPRQVRTACEGDGLIVVSAPTEAAVESLALALADWS